MITPAISSTEHNKADCSKYVICRDQVKKLTYVKKEDRGLNTFLNRIKY